MENREKEEVYRIPTIHIPSPSFRPLSPSIVAKNKNFNETLPPSFNVAPVYCYLQIFFIHVVGYQGHFSDACLNHLFSLQNTTFFSQTNSFSDFSHEMRLIFYYISSFPWDFGALCALKNLAPLTKCLYPPQYGSTLLLLFLAPFHISLSLIIYCLMTQKVVILLLSHMGKIIKLAYQPILKIFADFSLQVADFFTIMFSWFSKRC